MDASLNIDVVECAAPKGVSVRRGRKVASKNAIRSLKPKGNTVLRDFGRVLRDEPHKYIYPVKLYMVNNAVKAETLMEWLRDRYINAKGGRNHGGRYEVRTYKAADGQRYVDYILLEAMTDAEKTAFTMQFGEVTDTKLVRDGKLRRPRLTKEEKKEFDRMVNAYYLEIERKRLPS